MRGNVLPARPNRRHRSTRRRQDAPPLPKRAVDPRTVGKAYTTPDGKAFRPSLFVTLTCPSYGRVTADGTPADPDQLRLLRAARDALHFAALFDRFMQNLRRFVGYDIQYFAAVEPQRRLAPHVHIAMRGTVSRAELREVIAATYHQVWWPSTDTVRFDGAELPVWDEATAAYLDPDTGELLPTWDEALDAIGDEDEPLHVARFGDRFDAQGVLAGSRDANRCIGYLTKYLTKHVADCHQAQTERPGTRTPTASPTRCATNRARRPAPTGSATASSPRTPKPGMRPGGCQGKAHRREYLGYAGRRVLVSRKWSGKTLADHRADRKNWLTQTLGLEATDPAQYTWEPVSARRPRPHAHRPKTAPRRRRPHPLATGTRTSQTTSKASHPTNFRQPGRPHDRGRGEPRLRDRFAHAHHRRAVRMARRHERLARKLVERNAIPYRKVGHLLRFPEAEIEVWSHPERTVPPQATIPPHQPTRATTKAADWPPNTAQITDQLANRRRQWRR